VAVIFVFSHSNQRSVMQDKWYQKDVWIIVLLVIFFPVGIFLMWRYSGWNTWIKVTVSTAWALIILLTPALGEDVHNPQSTAESDSQSQASIKNNDQQNIADAYKVDSVIVKKVGDKYRYFFSVHNTNAVKVDVIVAISLVNTNDDDTFAPVVEWNMSDTDGGLRKAGYIETKLPVTESENDYGVEKYSYIVTIKGKEYFYKSRNISQKYEDTSIYKP